MWFTSSGHSTSFFEPPVINDQPQIAKAITAIPAKMPATMPKVSPFFFFFFALASSAREGCFFTGALPWLLWDLRWGVPFFAP